jgi:hypothetical protein
LDIFGFLSGHGVLSDSSDGSLGNWSRFISADGWERFISAKTFLDWKFINASWGRLISTGSFTVLLNSSGFLNITLGGGYGCSTSRSILSDLRFNDNGLWLGITGALGWCLASGLADWLFTIFADQWITLSL